LRAPRFLRARCSASCKRVTGISEGLGRAENPLALSSDSGLGPLGLVAQNGTRIKRLTCLPSAGWSPRMTDLVA